MGMFDKLKFWKKDDLDIGADIGLGGDLGLGKDMGLGKDSDLGLGKRDSNLGLDSDFGARKDTFPGMNEPGEPVQSQDNMGGSQYSRDIPPQHQRLTPVSVQQTAFSPQMDMIAKDIEVVSTKLDTLRASMESINQRLMHLERVAEGEYERKQRNW